jgi:hypothetical protein
MYSILVVRERMCGARKRKVYLQMPLFPAESVQVRPVGHPALSQQYAGANPAMHFPPVQRSPCVQSQFVLHCGVVVVEQSPLLPHFPPVTDLVAATHLPVAGSHVYVVSWQTTPKFILQEGGWHLTVAHLFLVGIQQLSARALQEYVLSCWYPVLQLVNCTAQYPPALSHGVVVVPPHVPALPEASVQAWPVGHPLLSQQ